MDNVEAIKCIGRVVMEYRVRKGVLLTQDKLAENLNISRTALAHLEEGRALLPETELSRVCISLGIPDRLWIIATHPYYVSFAAFEGVLSELIGRVARHSELDSHGQLQAVERAHELFLGGLTAAQSHAQFNAVLVAYGERPVTGEFYSHYLGVEAFRDPDAFLRHVRRFQADAMRLYGNFRRAWMRLSRARSLTTEIGVLSPASIAAYRGRTPFHSIKEIPVERLPQLGYIAVNRIKEQHAEREELAKYLNNLADAVGRVGSSDALQRLSGRDRLRIQALFRKVDIEGVELEHGLFQRLDPDLLRAYAKRVTPEDKDLAQIEDTQRQGLQNLAAYLTEPYLDAYVATSMRDDADFVAVNAFASALFAHPEINGLHLRYFNPTQSWIGDRVSKGLVEALMLRRSKMTIYMAQKSDTFGKDSEASVALGQGKTVIVYVPRLFDEQSKISSEETFAATDGMLTAVLEAMNVELEPGSDQRGKARLVLQEKLKRVDDEAMKRLLYHHWADFDLYGELVRIRDEDLRKACYLFLRAVRTAKTWGDAPAPEARVKAEMVNRLSAAAEMFEMRAKTFRDVHPLSLQVIVRSGVVNGILVCRSVESCARVIRGVVENNLRTEVVAEPENYRLVEQETKSTLRVVSRHSLLTNAFWTLYFDDSGRAVDDELLDASTI